MRIIERFERPYRHFIADNILDNDAAIALHAWLLRPEREWHLREEHFFSNYELALLPKRDPIIDRALPHEIVTHLVQSMEREFNVELDPRVRITALKMLANQSIGIHNDYYDPDNPVDEQGRPRETHRLSIGFTPDFSDDHGGLAAIMGGPYEDSPVFHMIRPIFNTGYGFEQCLNSYHAVTEATTDRLSLICYFYPRGALTPN